MNELLSKSLTMTFVSYIITFLFCTINLGVSIFLNIGMNVDIAAGMLIGCILIGAVFTCTVSVPIVLKSEALEIKDN